MNPCSDVHATGQAQSQSQVKGQITKSQRPSRVLLASCWLFIAGAKYHNIHHISILQYVKSRKDLILFLGAITWPELAFLRLEAPLLCALSWSGQPRRRRHTILQWQGIEVSVVTECHLWGSFYRVMFWIFMGVILHPTNEWRRNGWEVCDL